MRRPTGIVTSTLAAVLAAMLLLVPAAMAAPGDLDPSFGNGGRLIVNQAGEFDGVAIQPDGKIVLVGSVDVGGSATAIDMAITRLNADGSLDTGFGTGGTTLINYAPGQPGASVYDRANAVALQADGKIVVAGTFNSLVVGQPSYAAVVRLNADGSLDTSFHDPSGSGAPPGIALLETGEANAVAIDPLGRILVAGDTTGSAQVSPFVNRLESDGTYDPTFDQLPLVVAGDNWFYGLALQSDGKIVAVGEALPPTSDASDEMVTRLLDNGQLDGGFGTGGTLTLGLTGAPGNEVTAANAVAVQPDGSIDVAGSGGPNSDFTFARLTSSGQFDPSLGGGRPLTIDFGGDDGASAIALLANGKVLLGGYGNGRPDVNGSFAVARLQPDGVLDSTFGSGGQETVSFPGENAYATSMAVQPDGRIVLAGGAQAQGSGPAGVVVRLLGDPASTGGGPGGGGTGGPGSAGAGQGSGGHGPGAFKAKVLRCDGKRATIVGTNGNDRLRGTRHADVIVGLGGNDTISGLGGNDVICGGSGNDRISGGAGNDYIDGGAGNDRLSGGAGKDDLLGGPGKDNLKGGPGRDTLSGGPGRDTLSGGPGKDKLNGGPGRNTDHQ